MAQMRIFLSHSSTDKDFADALARALRDAGADVWCDSTHLGFGHLRRDISKQVASRPVFIVVLSKQAFASRWVTDECDWAYDLYEDEQQRGEQNRIIVPVVAGPIETNDWHEMLWLRGFRRVERPDGTPFPHAEAIAISLSLLRLDPGSEPPSTIKGFNPWSDMSTSLRLKFDSDESIIIADGATGSWKSDVSGAPQHDPEFTVPPFGGSGSSQMSSRPSTNKEIRPTQSSQTPSQPAAPREVICANCGVRNTPGRATCKNCGEPLKPTDN